MQQLIPSDPSLHFVNADNFRKYIEVEVLKIIKVLAEKGETPKEKIETIARKTLDLIQPSMSLETLYQNAVKLDDNCSELAPVVMHIMQEYEKKYNKKAITEVSRLIKSKQFDQAGDLVKKVLAFKMQN